jgi:hypothetical protein
MSINNKLKQHFEMQGIKISTRARIKIVHDYNNHKMPISERINRIIEGKESKLMEFIDKYRCPNCKEVFVGEGSYCSDYCLEQEMPFTDSEFCDKTGKVVYNSEREAKDTTKTHRKITGKLRVYKCEHCSKYHLTSNKKGVK